MMASHISARKNQPKLSAILFTAVYFILLGGNFVAAGNLKAGQNQVSSNKAANYNNLANLYLIESDMTSAKLDTAILYYQEAIKNDSSDGGIKLNLGIAYLVQSDTVAADFYFVAGLADCDSNLAKALYLLTIDLDPGEETKGRPESVPKSKIKNRLKIAAEKLKTKKQATNPPITTRSSRPAGPKHLNPGEVKQYLYWKY